MTNGTLTPKRRDSAATQRSLLDAAQELFGLKGYDDTTLREIGERAGVDASLIARYFGNKAALYIAVVGSEALQYQGTTIDESIDEVVDLLLARADTQGVGPISQALISPDIDSEIRTAAADRFQRRVISRLVAQMPNGLRPDARLRAEIAVSALIGVISVRARAGFYHLGGASRDDVATVLRTMLREALNPD
jgi:AcrR family transcriptional regulator